MALLFAINILHFCCSAGFTLQCAIVRCHFHMPWPFTFSRYLRITVQFVVCAIDIYLMHPSQFREPESLKPFQIPFKDAVHCVIAVL